MRTSIVLLCAVAIGLALHLLAVAAHPLRRVARRFVRRPDEHPRVNLAIVALSRSRPCGWLSVSLGTPYFRSEPSLSSAAATACVPLRSWPNAAAALNIDCISASPGSASRPRARLRRPVAGPCG